MKTSYILSTALCLLSYPILAIGTLFVISAPSGAGKTSLVQAALTMLQPAHPIERVISYTTKKPGPGELPGKDYHFINEQEFKAKIEQGFFLEWSGAYGKYYGSPTHVLNDVENDKSRILIVDRAGAERIHAQYPNAVLIWIHTKDIAILHERLIKRGRDSQEQVEKRIKLAQQELELEIHNPIFHHHLLNDDFGTATQNLVAIMESALTK